MCNSIYRETEESALGVGCQSIIGSEESMLLEIKNIVNHLGCCLQAGRTPFKRFPNLALDFGAFCIYLCVKSCNSRQG